MIACGHIFKHKAWLKVVESIAKWNGKVLDSQFYEDFKQMTEDLRSKQDTPDTISTMVRRYPVTRRNFLLITFNWLANAVAYNGLTYYSANLDVSPQLGFAISAAVEIPSYFLGWFLMDRVGRKRMLIATMGLGGLSCLCCSAVPAGSTPHILWETCRL